MSTGTPETAGEGTTRAEMALLNQLSGIQANPSKEAAKRVALRQTAQAAPVPLMLSDEAQKGPMDMI